MILLTGATGTTGRRVARRLTKWGYRFSALVRDPDKASGLKSSKVELIKGDFGKPDSLRRAMEGIEHAFLLPPNTKDQFKLERNFIDAARESGVKYLVKYSAIGANPDSPSRLLKWHGEAEEYLKQSGIRYSIIRPNIFMQNFTNIYARQIREEKQFRLPIGDARCGWVDVRDIGRLIAKILTENGHQNNVLTVTGPESLNCNEIGDILSNAVGKKIEYVDVKPKEFRKEMMESGVPERLAEAVSELYKLVSDGLCDVVTDTFYEITQKQPRTFDEFVDDNLSLFLKKKSKSKK
ncbi:MAG: SDR family oxidoreductase [Candidatus Dadabacteria bacterium]|nr:MAG: SDR family oxidoreductase [Candidatus Dadabacteria bacterium]